MTTKTKTTKVATPTVDPIAEMQSQIANLTAMIASLTQAVQVVPAEVAEVVPAKSAKAKGTTTKAAKAKAADAEAKKALHAERKAAYENARIEWANRTWADCIKVAAAEIRINRKANVRNANIAVGNIREWLSSVSNQGFMAARKEQDVPYATAMAALEKAAK
jgi:cell division septum initiation protein DivIVA